MKTLMTLFVLGIFSAAMVGCEAKAEVGDPDNDRTVEKKTTTSYDNGDKSVKTTTTIKND